ncbi:hypothetical protein A8950_2130 [Dongia mobilis]|uniref:Uncharacterized protein n=1 Tax=Dongia mobilis TaxID=578943 RepID=A0A4V3DEN6_9PROT|nr:hypothetical protein [Dongia mobilis]TDQ82308.1 hypothetical protein A8950_2130 [Dongia mobilis]
MRELAPEIVTRLMRAEVSPAYRGADQPAHRPDPADAVGVAIALAALMLAIALALAEIGDDVADAVALPPLTPLAEGHDWAGFSA